MSPRRTPPPPPVAPDPPPAAAGAQDRPSGRLRRRTVGVAVRSLLAAAIVLAIGNVAITAAWQWHAHAAVPGETLSIAGVRNLRVVDEKVWRGSAPGHASYVELAAAGATTVVDLRAEDDLDVDRGRLAELGMDLVVIPMRDGQAPTSTQVATFLDAVAKSRGPVFVHCGAGVGRTGTMVASYLVEQGLADGPGAMRQNLAVGPPSLEQLAFAATLGAGPDRPNVGLVAASRFLDAPRRAWTLLRR